MSEEPAVEEIDRRRIRIGLAMLSVVVAVALVAAIVLDDATARVLMLAIVVFTLGRAYFFTRRLRRDR